MKRFSILMMSVLGLCLAAASARAQDKVSKVAAPKAVLLEEQTGVGCGNCPDGAAMIKDLKNRMGDRLQVIAFHAGHYAEGSNYTTWQGDSLLHSLWGDWGYPQGAIDRVQFSQFNENQMVFGRSNWNNAIKLRQTDTATVNLYAEAVLDAATRTLTVKLEGYYFRDADLAQNFLHVALLQNHIVGPQNGAPAGYKHEHMFRDFLTPLWGDTLKETTAGSQFVKTYTYTVPEDYNTVKADLRYMDLVVFVTAGRGDVLNAAGCKPKLIGINDPAAATLTLGTVPKRNVARDFPAFIESLFNDTIRKVGYEVTLNEEKKTYTTDVTVAPYSEAAVTLRIDAYEPLESNTVSFRLVSINDQAYEGAAVSAKFNGPLSVVAPLTVEVATDARPEECYWYVADPSGEILAEFGPYEAGEPVKVTENLKLEEGYYMLFFCDLEGNGWQDRPRGSYKIKDFEGKLVAQNYDVREEGDRMAVRVTKLVSDAGSDTTAVETLKDKAGLSVSSAHGQLYIHNPLAVQIDNIRIFSMTGARLESHAVRSQGDVLLPLTVRQRVAVVEVESAGRFYRFKQLL